MHLRLVYTYLLNVPSFSCRYFNKIKRTPRLGRALALSLEILWLSALGHVRRRHVIGAIGQVRRRHVTFIETRGKFNNASALGRSFYWCQALHIMDKDRYQSTSARRALALLNSPQR